MTSPDLPTLDYRKGAAMSPIPTNISLAEVAERLRDDLPVYVELQPGDLTTYRFLLQPAWLYDALPGGGGDSQQELLIVTKFNGTSLGPSTYVPLGVDQLKLKTFMRPLSDFPWCHDLFGWWFACLGITMHAAIEEAGRLADCQVPHDLPDTTVDVSTIERKTVLQYLPPHEQAEYLGLAEPLDMGEGPEDL